MFRNCQAVLPIIVLVLVGVVVTAVIASADDAMPNSSDDDPPGVPVVDPPSVDPPNVDPPSVDPPSVDPPSVDPPSVDQARVRARLLYETIRGALQIMHRDFFDDESPQAIPSAEIEEVFDELEHQFGIELKWINVETDVLNVDHQPRSDFERRAARAIAKRQSFVEQVAADRYRYMGRIRLASQCLKCHLKNRRSIDDRSAGLLITIPLRQ